jgi:hypothetical protein
MVFKKVEGKDYEIPAPMVFTFFPAEKDKQNSIVMLIKVSLQ